MTVEAITDFDDTVDDFKGNFYLKRGKEAIKTA